MSRPSTLWFSHVANDPEKKKQFEAALQGSTVVLQRLRSILQQELDKLGRSEGTDEDFETPNWALKQAARARDNARLRWLLQELSFVP